MYIYIAKYPGNYSDKHENSAGFLKAIKLLAIIEGLHDNPGIIIIISLSSLKLQLF